MKHFFEYSDFDYRAAINYDGTDYYNCPITFNVDDNKSIIKFIIGCGTSDKITVTEPQHGKFYIVGKNAGLDYISMTVIDLLDNSVKDCYLSYNDINDPECFSYDVINKSTEEQILILSEYLN